MMNAFLKEAEQWLEIYGYSIHSFGAEGHSAIFMNTENLPNNKPAILVYEHESKKGCRLFDSGFKMFLTLTTGDLAYMHPDIERYITVMEHYSRLLTSNPPF